MTKFGSCLKFRRSVSLVSLSLLMLLSSSAGLAQGPRTAKKKAVTQSTSSKAQKKAVRKQTKKATTLKNGKIAKNLMSAQSTKPVKKPLVTLQAQEFETTTPTAGGVTASSSSALQSNTSGGTSKMKVPQKKSETKPGDFSFSGYAYQIRPQRPEKNAKSEVEANFGYDFAHSGNAVVNFTTTLDYSYTWAKTEAESVSQLDVIEFAISRTHSFGSSGNNIFYGAGTDVPANEADRIAGMKSVNFGLLGGNVYFAGIHRFKFLLVPAIYDYAYDTTTPAGDMYNRKYSLLGRMWYYLAFTDKFKWRNRLSLLTYRNYAENDYQTYGFQSSLTYSFSPMFTVLGGIVTNDRIVSTNTVLEDKITSYRAGFEWSF